VRSSELVAVAIAPLEQSAALVADTLHHTLRGLQLSAEAGAPRPRVDCIITRQGVRL
jgi:hypothetical protein